MRSGKLKKPLERRQPTIPPTHSQVNLLGDTPLAQRPGNEGKLRLVFLDQPARQGCHTAAIQDYVVEGHVPPEAIAKLLDERPKDHGISVPGMPQGSVGMGDDPRAQYDVVTFDAGPAANSRVFYRAGH